MVGEGFVTKEAFGIFSRNLNRRIGALEAGGGGGGGGGSGLSTFLSLTDTPGTYAGASLKYVRVNSGVSALEFGARMTVSASAPSGGDNGDLWFQYDTDLLVGGTGASGQVAYWTGTSSLAGSNNLFWDNANGRLGIGTIGPDSKLTVVAADPGSNYIPGIVAIRANDALAADVGGVLSLGARYTDTLYTDFAVIAGRKAIADSGNYGGYLVFYTRLHGTVPAQERMRITTTGNVGIGTIDPKSPLHVVGLPVFANNATAVTMGLTAGAFYRNNADPDVVCVVH